MTDDTIDRALRDAAASSRLSESAWEAHRTMKRYLAMAKKSDAEERVWWLDMARAARRQAHGNLRAAARRMAIARASLLSLEGQLRASLKGAA